MSVGNVLLEKSIEVFILNLLDSNTTNIVKDVLIILTEDIHKKITPSRENMRTLQKPVRNFNKKFMNMNPK